MVRRDSNLRHQVDQRAESLVSKEAVPQENGGETRTVKSMNGITDMDTG